MLTLSEWLAQSKAAAEELPATDTIIVIGLAWAAVGELAARSHGSHRLALLQLQGTMVDWVRGLIARENEARRR